MKVCSRCGCSIGDRRKKCLFCGAPNDFAVDSSSYNRKSGGTGGYSVLKVISMLIILMAVFAPLVGMKGFGNYSFWYTLTQSSVDLFESRVTWMALAAIVPAVLILIGACKKNKWLCLIASLLANLFLFIAFGDLVDSYVDNFGSSFGVEYMLGENSPLTVGFWGLWIGHLICLICSLVVKDQ